MQSKVRKCGILLWASKKIKPAVAAVEDSLDTQSTQSTSSQNSTNTSQELDICESTQKSIRQKTKKEADTWTASKEKVSGLSFLSPPRDKFGRTSSDLDYDRTTLFIEEKELSIMTPCEEQFWRIKMEYFDTIVFFKKGKFYELFEDDALLSSELFGLKLTKRGSMRMTGIPEMSLDVWTEKFIHKGYKVAIIDQKETSVSQNMRVKSGDSKQKVIERELKEVVTEITAGTEGAGICSLFVRDIDETERVNVEIAVFRPMESELFVLSFEDDRELFKVKSIIKKENIKEIITDRIVTFKEKVVKIRPDIWEQNVFSIIKSIGKDKTKEEQYALQVLLSYLQYLKYAFTPQLIEYTEKSKEQMEIDGRTIEMLCLIEGPQKQQKKFSLFGQIDQTRTKPGRRLLRQWIIAPLASLPQIEKRYNTAEILENAEEKSSIEEELKNIGDINDFIKKAKNYKIRPEEIRKLVVSLKAVGKIYILLQNIIEKKIKETHLEDIILKISTFSVYNTIIAGFDISHEIMPLSTDPELIAAEAYKQKVVNILEMYAKNESAAASILFTVKKIGREHFLECKHGEKVSQKYIASGSTKNTARYTTAELRKLSETYLEAEEKITFLATESISRISKRISDASSELKNISQGIAELDCFISFTYISGVKPVFSETLKIKELTNVSHTHVPNSLSIDKNRKLIVVTGPNMAGKSTFLRNVSICIVLRQIGAKVPAKYFSAPIYDRIFTRIGANDNLAEGESTFQIEMKETADILNNATDKSFVIIDELGRGTSTREGSAISFAVKEYLKTVGCTTLYATHFFSAISESDRKMKMDYKYVINAQQEEEILYLYKLVDGVCIDSCGIDICKITKVPQTVIQRALEIKKSRALSAQLS